MLEPASNVAPFAPDVSTGPQCSAGKRPARSNAMDSSVNSAPGDRSLTILQRIAAGDELAVAECFERYDSLIWTLARRLGVPGPDVEDAVQDAFVAIWKAAGKFDPNIASEKTFVATIARRRVVDKRRSATRGPPRAALDDVAEPAAPPDAVDFAEFADEAGRVERAMETLEPERRRVLELSVVRGLTHDAIAKQLELPLGTVKSHTRRGLAKVRGLLGLDPDPPG
jgi:RNA polymerase sigma-70 factor, ECF subfamily